MRGMGPIGAVDRENAEAPGAGEGEILLARLLTEGGVGVHR